MDFANIIRILGLFLIMYSPSMLTPLVVNYIYQDGSYQPFLIAFAVILLLGSLFWLPVKNLKHDLRIKEGFLVVVLFWIVTAVVSAIPFWIAWPELSVMSNLFESVSGITTTGATILVNLDELPHHLLYYRQQLQLLGGMGIIVLAVAIFPLLGIGGMQLFRAEISGIAKDKKLAPRIEKTAKILWFIYLLLTGACIICFKLFGMNWFDAICYGFSTVSTGGFAPHDASIAFYPSIEIYTVSVIFMLLGSLSFSLHYFAMRNNSIESYWQDPEAKFYLKLVLAAIIFFAVSLYIYEMHDSFQESLIAAIYQVISLSTTAGFVSEDYVLWPSSLPYLLFYLAILGGCAGSTSGGLKAVRALLLYRQGMRELKRLIHPQGQFLITYSGRTLSLDIIYSVWGYIATYLIIFLLFFLAALTLHLDFETAFAGVASSLGNIGPGLGKVTHNFAGVSDASKVLFMVAMLFGRLEIFTFLVLFTPYFWRK